MEFSRNTELQRIVAAVSTYLQISQKDILGRRKYPNVARARMFVMFLARQHTDYSFAEIGLMLNRDHSTVIHGFRTIDRDDRVQTVRQIERIKKLLSKQEVQS